MPILVSVLPIKSGRKMSRDKFKQTNKKNHSKKPQPEQEHLSLQTEPFRSGGSQKCIQSHHKKGRLLTT